MTQQEFQLEMELLNDAQYQETRPLLEQLAECDRKKNELQNKVEAIQMLLRANKQDRFAVMAQIKEVKAKYHDMKHQLIVENPKKQEADATCTGAKNEESRPTAEGQAKQEADATCTGAKNEESGIKQEADAACTATKNEESGIKKEAEQ